MFKINITCLSCFSCCPVINLEQTQVAVADGPTASLGFPFKDPTCVEKVEGQVGQNLLNQGLADAEVYRFVSRVELGNVPIPVDRSNSPIPRDNINLRSQGFNHFDSTSYYTLRDERDDNEMNQKNWSEYPGSESSPSPRKQDSVNPISVAGSLQLNMSQGNPEGERSDSPPPPPPPPPPPRNFGEGSQVTTPSFLLPLSVRLSESLSPGNNPILDDSDARLNVSLRNLEGGRPDSPPPPPPFPRIELKKLSPGFMSAEPYDPKTGGRLSTIEEPKRPFTSVEVTRTNPSNASQLIGDNESELWI